MSAFVSQLVKGRSHAPRIFDDSDGTESPILQSNPSTKPIRRESKLTLAGGLYILVTMFIAVGAINSQNNLLFWLFGVSIATLIVSGVFSGNALMQVRLEAQALTDVCAGDPVKLHYLISNRSRFFPLFAVMISEIRDSHHPFAQTNPAGILHLGPKQTIKVVGTMTPTSRGRYTIQHVRLSTRFPFGFLQKSLIFDCPRTLMVLPYELELQPGLVRTLKGRGDEVQRRSRGSGKSAEYWGLREYTHGDSKRSIAWKQSAKHGSLVVIEHAQPIATRVWIWISLDHDDVESDTIQVERAIALASSLITQAVTRAVPFGIWAPAFGVRMQPSMGKAHMLRCKRALGLIDLAIDSGRNLAPSVTGRDDVIAIKPGQHAISTQLNTRILSASKYDDWLKIPGSMPVQLHSTGGKRQP